MYVIYREPINLFNIPEFVNHATIRLVNYVCTSMATVSCICVRTYVPYTMKVLK